MDEDEHILEGCELKTALGRMADAAAENWEENLANPEFISQTVSLRYGTLLGIKPTPQQILSLLKVAYEEISEQISHWWINHREDPMSQEAQENAAQVIAELAD